MPVSAQSDPSGHATWVENDQAHKAVWLAPNNDSPPRRIQVVDDTLNADSAFRLVNEGTSLLWRGDFQNARQLLNALARRIDKKKTHRSRPAPAHTLFNLHRLAQSQRARLLNSLLIQVDGDYHIPLRRAPDVKEACQAVFGPAAESFLISLRALQGIIGAFEWRKKGIAIPALAQNIHVHYGVFSPIRGEYIDLVAHEPLPDVDVAFDIGTGSGVLAALLAHRGVPRVIATDLDPRALACARDNFKRLGLCDRIELQEADLFPAGQSALIVCNPPWLPARPTSPIESAIYDPDSRMLLAFLSRLHEHLTVDGQAWLIMSDLAEHLGLRPPEFLPEAIEKAGLHVLGKQQARPKHPKASDEDDPLHEARSAEITTLWRLGRTRVGRSR